MAAAAAPCSSPKIGDTVRRLCLDGPDRQPKFIIPTIADDLASGRSVSGLALESALWCRYCYGVTESGANIEPNDSCWNRLQAQARRARDGPVAWLEMEEIYGSTGRSERFRAEFSRWLRQLWAKGSEAVLQHYVTSVAKPVK